MPRCDAAPIQLGQTGGTGRWGTGAKGRDLIAAPPEASTSPIFNEAEALLGRARMSRPRASYPTGLSKRLLAPSRGICGTGTAL